MTEPVALLQWDAEGGKTFTLPEPPVMTLRWQKSRDALKATRAPAPAPEAAQ